MCGRGFNDPKGLAEFARVRQRDRQYEALERAGGSGAVIDALFPVTAPREGL